MARFLVLLAALSALPACSKAKADGSQDMTCQRIAYGSVTNGQRCENSEAVCYMSDNGSMSCLKK